MTRRDATDDVDDAGTADALPTVRTLDELTELVGAGEELYVRWSQSPAADVHGDRPQTSHDGLTGVPLPGLSANPLRVEDWWGDRSRRLWVARRLYDYRHLRARYGAQVRAWVLVGRLKGRGPDNEPLVVDVRPLAWIAEEVLAECERIITEPEGARRWGPLDRSGPAVS